MSEPIKVGDCVVIDDKGEWKGKAGKVLEIYTTVLIRTTEGYLARRRETEVVVASQNVCDELDKTS